MSRSTMSDPEPDTLTRAQVVQAPVAWLTQRVTCHHCVAGDCRRCWKAICNHGCPRVPMVGWPANGVAL